MENLKKELEGIATKLDATVEKFQTANAEEVKGLKAEFQNLTKQYNDLSAKLEKDLQTVQGSVDELNIEKKRLSESRKAQKDLRTALTEQLSSDEFKSYLKSKKSGDKRAKHNIVMENVDSRKAAVTPSTATADTSSPDYLNTGIIYDFDRDMFVRNFIPSGATTANSVVVPIELTITDGTAVTAEGIQKGVSQFTLDNKAFPVMKIAAVLKISEEMLDDVPGLVTYIVNRWGSKLKVKEDATILYSVASATAFDGLTVAAQAYVDALADSAVTKWDVLMNAITQVRIDEYRATAIMMNPADVLTLKTEKGSDGNYLGRSPWDRLPMFCDGVQIIETTAIGPGEFLVGDFTRGAQIFDRKTASINFFDQDEDNAQKNLITVVIEERLALAVYRPNAFVYGDFASALAKGSA
jgi:HK97 family phage major capsid protein